MTDGMHRQLRHLLTLLLYHQRFPFLMQIAALGGDVECVLQFAHGEGSWGLTVVFGLRVEGYLKTVGRILKSDISNPL